MAHFVKIDNLHFSYDNLKQDLIKGVTHTFYPGWTSLCGENGAGKTTLFKLIAGELHPEEGCIQNSGLLVHIPQSTENPPDQLNLLKNPKSSQHAKILVRLAIQEDWMERWQSLSLGERKRLQIAIALFQYPDILLVDEPTNHLDTSTRAIIFEEFRIYRGIGLMISHDRQLLNGICMTTAFVDSGSLRVYSAPYDQAKEELNRLTTEMQRQKSLLSVELRKNTLSAQLQKEKIGRRKKSLSKSGLDKHDCDAREKINRAKCSDADHSDSKRRRAIGRQIERIEKESEQINVKKTYDLGIFFENPFIGKKILVNAGEIKTEWLNISYPDLTQIMHLNS